MILNKNNFYKHMFFRYFVILFGNIINGFLQFFSVATLYKEKLNFVRFLFVIYCVGKILFDCTNTILVFNRVVYYYFSVAI